MTLLNWIFAGISILLLWLGFSERGRRCFEEKGWMMRAEEKLQRIRLPYAICTLVLLLVGIGLRTYKFGTLPEGLNQDGCRAGMEALFLLHDGVDSAGNSWPTYFEAWKFTNMSTLYSWMLMPFIHFLGTTVIALRLPSLILSLLSLLVLWDLARRTMGKSYSLVVLFLAVLNPWQMMQSRWGIDANIMPHILLLGVYFLYLGLSHRSFLYLSMVFFAATVYAYGLASFLSPLFLLILLIYLIHTKQVPVVHLLGCAFLFFALAGPYYMTMAINAFGLESVHLGPITMPYFSQSHRASEIALASSDPIAEMGQNLWYFLKIFIQFFAGSVCYDAVPWAFALFPFTTVLYLFGFFYFWKKRRSRVRLGQQNHLTILTQLLYAWFAGSFFVGMQTASNIMRANSLFYPLLLLLGLTILEMGKNRRLLACTAMGMVLILFPFFLHSYYAPDFQQELSLNFRGNLYQALKDTWDWDYDQYYVGVNGGVDERTTWPQLMYAHAIDYGQWQEERELTGPDGEPTDWYYGERYFFITDPDAYEGPDPMECAVYVMSTPHYRDFFDEEEFLILDYNHYFAAYPRYWVE